MVNEAFQRLYNSIKEKINRKVEKNLVHKEKLNKAEKQRNDDVNNSQKLKDISVKTFDRAGATNKSFNITEKKINITK